jgi:hypothetical protein
MGEILMGAGFGGLAYDALAPINPPKEKEFDAQWGIAVASGAIFAGIGMVVEAELLSPASKYFTSKMGTMTARSAPWLSLKVVKWGLPKLTHVGLAAADGATQAAVFNGVMHKEWSDNVLTSAYSGVIGYALTRGMSLTLTQ